MSDSSTQPTTPESYNCMINEHQRALVVRALQAALLNPALRDSLRCQPSDNGEDSAFADLEGLVEMLVELPVIESESPGILHGLCL